MPELLEVERLRVRFPAVSPLRARLAGLANRWIDAVADVSFSLAAGGSFALVGESGSGKSTLGRAILGLVAIFSGEIRLEGERLSPHDEPALKAWRRRVAMTFQDPVGSLSPRLTVRALVAEPFRIHGLCDRDPAIEVRRLLALVGLGASALDRHPHELSGGQARRVGIARALALQPLLLIADEPTAGLDVSVQGEVLNLIGGLRAEFGLALLLITHNLAAVRLSADQIGVMYMGRLVEVRPTEELFASPAHPYTEALIGAMLAVDPSRRKRRSALRGEIPSLLHRPKGCEFHTRCPYADELCRLEAPKPRPLPRGGRVTCHRPLIPIESP
jgi:oligopeptide/dipeptide ABC transporter ATP-binding protein